MKKKLQNLFKSNLPKTATCGVHMESQLPYLRPLEYCNSCNISFCYTCGNKHFDKYCDVEWGLEVFTFLEPPRNEKNEKFNMGYPFGVDITKLKCPCGTPFLSKNTSAICSACGTATCSAECHDEFAQKDGKCLFINNFTPNEITATIQGLRLIKVTDFINAMKVNLPVFSPSSLSNSKFIKSLTSPFPFYFILQRGFRQYGQPHEVTLESLEDFHYDKDGITSKDMYEKFSSRLCMCECMVCANRSPHPIYNCYHSCEENEKLSEQDKLKLQIYQKCRCTCSYCLNCKIYLSYLGKTNHTTDECMRYCHLNSFKRF